MNPVKRGWMTIQGLWNPSEEYFAKECEAPTSIVESELKQAKDLAKYQQSMRSDYADTAVYIDGNVHDNGVFTAKTNVLYDPSSANEPLENILQKKHQDNEAVSVTPAKEYEPNNFYHTHNTIHIPHGRIMDEPSPLTTRTHSNVTIGLTGLPTIDDSILKDYHS